MLPVTDGAKRSIEWLEPLVKFGIFARPVLSKDFTQVEVRAMR